MIYLRPLSVTWEFIIRITHHTRSYGFNEAWPLKDGERSSQVVNGAVSYSLELGKKTGHIQVSLKFVFTFIECLLEVHIPRK